MNWILSSLRRMAIVCTLTGMMVSELFYALPAESATRFTPPPLPKRGTPTGHPQGGASRGSCPPTASRLTALMPVLPKGSTRSRDVSVWGLTMSDRPTFWFYVPHPLTRKSPLEFVLQDEQGRYIYQSTLASTETAAGVVNFKLPATVPPLQAGKRYHWYFLIYCTPDNPVFVDGWVERKLDTNLQRQLQMTDPRRQVQLYAANGIWYDALTLLAQLRWQKPQDQSLAEDWTTLLKSSGLGGIATAPFVNCCAPLK